MCDCGLSLSFLSQFLSAVFHLFVSDFFKYLQGSNCLRTPLAGESEPGRCSGFLVQKSYRLSVNSPMRRRRRKVSSIMERADWWGEICWSRCLKEEELLADPSSVCGGKPVSGESGSAKFIRGRPDDVKGGWLGFWADRGPHKYSMNTEHELSEGMI